ncbi:MAG: molybdopterin converting factor subunit 1 [Acidobacteriia bacterium]|nr:molybdopterin converting factor subunit 1 [Terriglobia bacterium]
MKVQILFFARLKELLHQETVEITVPENSSVSDVFKVLTIQYPEIESFRKSILIAINQEFATWETLINEGDELALFPPVSGGQASSTLFYDSNVLGDVYQIVRKPIQVNKLTQQLGQGEDGAMVTFIGVVRNNTQGRSTMFLEYEGYEPMAIRKLSEIGTIIHRQWQIGHIGIVHRLGRLEIGEVSVAIVITSPHRKVAFEVCQYAIDTLKKIVPIWKKEFFEDGEIWVEGATT